MVGVRPSSGPIRFGSFEVDPNSGELRKQGVKIKLQDQPLQILQVFLEHPGEVVTREELQKRVWPSDTFVDFDHGLYNAIKRLRESLGDTAETPRFIETIPRRGYRFIGPVNGDEKTVLAAVEVSSRRQSPGVSRRGFRLGIGIGVLAAALLLVLLEAVPTSFWRRFSAKDEIPQIHSIAVLPLASLSTDPAQEYFAEGVTDALITDLAQISALKVVSRTTVMRYGRSDKSLPQIARELNVDGIVEGTVQRSGDRFRITAQLIYGPADRHLWAKSFERDVKDVLALQSTVASEVANEIQVKITPAEQAKLANVRSVNPKALDAYVEARFHLDQAGQFEYFHGKQQTLKEELRKAVSYLDRAILEDPNYIPAYVAYFNTVAFANTAHLAFLPRAKAALAKALELDESNVDAHLALARLLMQFEYDWAGAEREYKRAIQLNPNSADAHFQYAEYLDNVEGVLDKNVRETSNAKRERDLAQALDPAHDYFGDFGFHREGNTVDQNRQALEEKAPNDPFALAVMGKDYAIAGRYKESVEMWERSLTLYGWHDFVSVLKRADAKGGPKFALEEWMRAGEEYAKTHDDWSVVAMAFTYSSLGKKDRAFAWLDKAVEQRSWMIIELKDDSVWDPLRSDPRFKDLLHRVRLP